MFLQANKSLQFNYHSIIILFLLLPLILPECDSSTNPTTIIKTSRISPPQLKVNLTTDPVWIQASLQRHNYLRSLHRAQPLVLNKTLCEISQSWANYLLSRSLENIRNNDDLLKDNFFFEHNTATNRKYFIGENLYFSTHSRGVQINGTIAVSLWYDEIKDYDFQFARVKATSRQDSLIGHFTQLVWNATNQMGTAFATGNLPTGQLVTMIVANYYPTGNIVYRSDFPQKLYIKNVIPPIATAENEIEDVETTIFNKIQFWELSTNGTTTPQSWINLALDKHNEYRHHHDFPLLVESSQLSSISQSWADRLVNRTVSDFNSKWTIEGRFGFANYAVTEKARFGESILYLVGDGFVNPEQIVTLWYEQHHFYDFDNMRPDSNKSRTAQIYNFEQIMWKATSHFGMAFASKKAENGQVITFVVANYYPRASWAKFEDKVENLPRNYCDKIDLSTKNLQSAKNSIGKLKRNKIAKMNNIMQRLQQRASNNLQ